MKVAAVNWKVRPIQSQHEFWEHADELVGAAAQQGAELVVLPEFFVLELLHLEPGLSENEVPAFISQVFDPTSPEHNLAVKHDCEVVLGSYFTPLPPNRFVNTTSLLTRDGEIYFSGKGNLTQYEVHVWDLASHDRAFAWGQHGISVTVCYDSEFPELGRAVAEAGSLLQCVPAFTEAKHGFGRVRHSCHARAIENQIFVIHSSLIGSLGREPVPDAVGSSAVIAPCIDPFPPSGVLAETPWNEEGLAIADVDFEALLLAREEGDVRNWHDRQRIRWHVDRIADEAVTATTASGHYGTRTL